MFGVFLVLSLWASTASGFTINSGFSDPCHEQITIQAFTDYLSTLPTDQIPVPTSEEWRKIAESFEEDLNLEIRNDQQRVLLISLLLGVRSPDTDGHSLLNIIELRENHSSPDGQYAHALRELGDDGPAGDVVAVEGTRQHILERIELAFEYFSRPTDQQIIEVPVYLDFYGRFRLEVWAPAFYIGEAAHALQDSFAHAIRTDDMRRIVHVMNFIDAITFDYDEERDGLAHSDRLDDCTGETAPAFSAATEATISLFIAVTFRFQPDPPSPNDPTVEGVLDRWVTLETGCTFENAYCNSFWAELARESLTGPYLECSGSGGRSSGGYWWVALLAVVGLRRWATR